jgi:membrane protein DedA with SNARE-associated domain
MHWRTFLIYNAAGGIVWATIFGTLGYVAGRFFHDNFAQVERLATTLGWLGTGLIIFAVLVVLIVFRMRRRKRAQTLTQTVAIEEKQKEELKTGQ